MLASPRREAARACYGSRGCLFRPLTAATSRIRPPLIHSVAGAGAHGTVLCPQSLAQAAGTTVTVPTLQGEEDIQVPAGTQPGTVVTLRGRGLSTLGRGPPRWSASGSERAGPSQPQRPPA